MACDDQLPLYKSLAPTYSFGADGKLDVRRGELLVARILNKESARIKECRKVYHTKDERRNQVDDSEMR